MAVGPARRTAALWHAPSPGYLWREPRNEWLEHALPPGRHARWSGAVLSLTPRTPGRSEPGLAAVEGGRASPGPPATLSSYTAVGSRVAGVPLSFLPWVHSACPARPTVGIEELCQKREELCRQIQQEEDEKQRLQSEVRQLTEKLARVNENLARKIASRNEFDRTIAETEAAYLKVGLGAGREPACLWPAGGGPGAPTGRGDRTTTWSGPLWDDSGAVSGARHAPSPVLCTVVLWLVPDHGQRVAARAGAHLVWLPRVQGGGLWAKGSADPVRPSCQGLPLPASAPGLAPAW